MSMEWSLVVTAGICALLPAVLFLRNLPLYRPPPPAVQRLGPVSVLIPARNEEQSISASLHSVLASEGIDFEVIVLDDASQDRTYHLVRGISSDHPQVRLEKAPSLPPGWCGKQHACAALAGLARHPILVFMDADVRLTPDGLARSVAFLEKSGAALVSGFPFEQTGTWLEKLLIPLIHFILLGFLPIKRMRKSLLPSFGAGCGQLVLVRREAYEQVGGHGACRNSLHEGVQLPRIFRRAGYATDLFDATHIACCHMYRGAREVWSGLSKNATEGLGAPKTIVPMTLLLLLGQVLPPLLVAVGLAGWISGAALGLAVVATCFVYLPRLIAVHRFQQPLAGALLHPVGILLLLVIQWQALLRLLRGRPASWKGRDYSHRPYPQ